MSCPKCGSEVRAISASSDECSNPACDYTFYYRDAYAGDGHEDPLRDVPFEEKARIIREGIG